MTLSREVCLALVVGLSLVLPLQVARSRPGVGRPPGHLLGPVWRGQLWLAVAGGMIVASPLRPEFLAAAAALGCAASSAILGRRVRSTRR